MTDATDSLPQNDQPQANEVFEEEGLAPQLDNSGESSPDPDRYRGFRGFFRELQDDLFIHNKGPEWTWRDLIFLCAFSTLLTLFYYWGRPHYFRTRLRLESLDRVSPVLTDFLTMVGMGPTWEYYQITPYFYWAFMSIFMRMVLPILLIVFLFKDQIRDYGYRLVGEVAHAKIYLFLYFFMLPLVIAVSYVASFQGKYPFYSGSMKGLDHFVIYQVSYGIQFFALEAFFRGFVLFALFKRFGYYAVPLMTVPYCMIHFGKPMPETLAAIAAGIILGFMSLKTRSIWMGAALHVSVALTMDFCSLWRLGRFD